ncbi:hypothetical protein TVAG_020920 [Trichomonas vaginalis G3]|uniref:Uncharacterized protein n=1 Tax=Trichomonas vaginalis (strain ATCC PRA-98 / G3) TaxID=412133 RepID=A2DH74_TRIV3|nr:hypothetical protein TVAGG3_0677110 [Trichomonas vaginalis G3]EAY20147.1 hypothetical protein TVAG_020920 [Trichomonas vaginalis G3]KAI5507614.1 hypothetical protein TVAGG3_0677110 [Trichomonas vaginalis G3]|eukprot:XP_001581133.1 hypothetical protein [Trichomonas vaginalis G3]
MKVVKRIRKIIHRDGTQTILEVTKEKIPVPNDSKESQNNHPSIKLPQNEQKIPPNLNRRGSIIKEPKISDGPHLQSGGTIDGTNSPSTFNPSGLPTNIDKLDPSAERFYSRTSQKIQLAHSASSHLQDDSENQRYEPIVYTKDSKTYDKVIYDFESASSDDNEDPSCKVIDDRFIRYVSQKQYAKSTDIRKVVQFQLKEGIELTPILKRIRQNYNHGQFNVLKVNDNKSNSQQIINCNQKSDIVQKGKSMSGPISVESFNFEFSESASNEDDDQLHSSLQLDCPSYNFKYNRVKKHKNSSSSSDYYSNEPEFTDLPLPAKKIRKYKPLFTPKKRLAAELTQPKTYHKHKPEPVVEFKGSLEIPDDETFIKQYGSFRPALKEKFEETDDFKKSESFPAFIDQNKNKNVIKIDDKYYVEKIEDGFLTRVRVTADGRKLVLVSKEEKKKSPSKKLSRKKSTLSVDNIKYAVSDIPSRDSELSLNGVFLSESRSYNKKLSNGSQSDGDAKISSAEFSTLPAIIEEPIRELKQYYDESQDPLYPSKDKWSGSTGKNNSDIETSKSTEKLNNENYSESNSKQDNSKDRIHDIEIKPKGKKRHRNSEMHRHENSLESEHVHHQRRKSDHSHHHKRRPRTHHESLQSSLNLDSDEVSEKVSTHVRMIPLPPKDSFGRESSSSPQDKILQNTILNSSPPKSEIAQPAVKETTQDTLPPINTNIEAKTEVSSQIESPKDKSEVHTDIKSHRHGSKHRLPTPPRSFLNKQQEKNENEEDFDNENAVNDNNNCSVIAPAPPLSDAILSAIQTPSPHQYYSSEEQLQFEEAPKQGEMSPTRMNHSVQDSPIAIRANVDIISPKLHKTRSSSSSSYSNDEKMINTDKIQHNLDVKNIFNIVVDNSEGIKKETTSDSKNTAEKLTKSDSNTNIDDENAKIKEDLSDNIKNTFSSTKLKRSSGSNKSVRFQALLNVQKSDSEIQTDETEEAEEYSIQSNNFMKERIAFVPKSVDESDDTNNKVNSNEKDSDSKDSSSEEEERPPILDENSVKSENQKYNSDDSENQIKIQEDNYSIIDENRHHSFSSSDNKNEDYIVNQNASEDESSTSTSSPTDPDELPSPFKPVIEENPKPFQQKKPQLSSSEEDSISENEKVVLLQMPNENSFNNNDHLKTVPEKFQVSSETSESDQKVVVQKKPHLSSLSSDSNSDEIDEKTISDNNYDQFKEKIPIKVISDETESSELFIPEPTEKSQKKRRISLKNMEVSETFSSTTSSSSEKEGEMTILSEDMKPVMNPMSISPRQENSESNDSSKPQKPLEIKTKFDNVSSDEISKSPLNAKGIKELNSKITLSSSEEQTPENTPTPLKQKLNLSSSEEMKQKLNLSSSEEMKQKTLVLPPTPVRIQTKPPMSSYSSLGGSPRQQKKEEFEEETTYSSCESEKQTNLVVGLPSSISDQTETSSDVPQMPNIKAAERFNFKKESESDTSESVNIKERKIEISDEEKSKSDTKIKNSDSDSIKIVKNAVLQDEQPVGYKYDLSSDNDTPWMNKKENIEIKKSKHHKKVKKQKQKTVVSPKSDSDSEIKKNKNNEEVVNNKQKEYDSSDSIIESISNKKNMTQKEIEKEIEIAKEEEKKLLKSDSDSKKISIPLDDIIGEEENARKPQKKPPLSSESSAAEPQSIRHKPPRIPQIHSPPKSETSNKKSEKSDKKSEKLDKKSEKSDKKSEKSSKKVDEKVSKEEKNKQKNDEDKSKTMKSVEAKPRTKPRKLGKTNSDDEKLSKQKVNKPKSQRIIRPTLSMNEPGKSPLVTERQNNSDGDLSSSSSSSSTDTQISIFKSFKSRNVTSQLIDIPKKIETPPQTPLTLNQSTPNLISKEKSHSSDDNEDKPQPLIFKYNVRYNARKVKSQGEVITSNSGMATATNTTTGGTSSTTLESPAIPEIKNVLSTTETTESSFSSENQRVKNFVNQKPPPMNSSSESRNHLIRENDNSDGIEFVETESETSSQNSDLSIFKKFPRVSLNHSKQITKSLDILQDENQINDDESSNKDSLNNFSSGKFTFSHPEFNLLQQEKKRPNSARVLLGSRSGDLGMVRIQPPMYEEDLNYSNSESDSHQNKKKSQVKFNTQQKHTKH